MRKPLRSWLLPMLGILFLLQSSWCLRATKTTTTTSTEAPTEEEVSATSSETSSVDGNQTATKPPLTGIPQIDYIWDPNLPRELNGFNLTDYPFYETIPKDIDFKCDGLHDGFYASVTHKCQVYHHCLFGTRFDFLCANFTAFDQKTFICHFVSEVDCVNSPKYWHRNDALYEPTTTTTTTTLAPITVRTEPPIAAVPRRPLAPGRRRRPLRRRRPQYDYYEEYDEYETDRERDDYYDEPKYQATEPPRPDGRRKRKRPRPTTRRPEYEEYDEYEDERFDRRGSSRRDADRRPYERRPSRKDPRKEEDPKYVDGDQIHEDRRRPEKVPDRKFDDRRRPVDDDYERRPYHRKSFRRPVDGDRHDNVEERRPFDRRKEDEDKRYRPIDDKDDRRPYERPKKNNDDERRYRPKDTKPEEGSKRYVPKEKEEPKGLVRPSSGSSIYDRPRSPPIIRRPVPLSEKDRFNYKPVIAVKPIKPVSSVEDEEYYEDYEDELPKSSTSKPTKKPEVETTEGELRTSFRSRRPQTRPYKQEQDETRRPQKEFEPRDFPNKSIDDSEEDEISPKSTVERDDIRRQQTRPIVDGNYPRRLQKRPVDDVGTPKRSQKRPQEYSDESRRSNKRPEIRPIYEVERVNQKHKVLEDDVLDDEYDEDTSKSIEEPPVRRPSKYIPRDRIPETIKVQSTTKEIRERPEPIVRVVKRPFLPSRGGNPYVSRGLQPNGARAIESSEKLDPTDASVVSPETIKESKLKPDSSREKPSSSEEQYDDEPEEMLPTKKEELSIEDLFKPVTTRPNFRQNFRSESAQKYTTEPEATSKSPKQTENFRNPLDINENEYDVTLNDALNPTIPNLPIRSIPTGFGAGSDQLVNSYKKILTGRATYANPNYANPRFIAIEAPLISASSDYIYQNKEPQGRLQESSSNPGYATYMRTQSTGYQRQNYRHPTTASGQYYTTF